MRNGLGKDFVVRENVDIIERGGADETAQYLLRLWQTELGKMPNNRALNALSPFLVVFEDFCYDGDTPDILFHGGQTLFAKHFPEAEEEVDLTPKSLLGTLYRQKVSQGYQDALQGEPVFETVGTGNLLGAHKPEIIYDRLILRFDKKIGSYLVSYSIKRDVRWLSAKEDPEDFQKNSPHTSDFHLSSKVDSSRLFRSDATA
ncbi:hypothetical protein [Roseibium alexandrii]|uniref:Uncharacterized protein n=1 Tax=Roseibium alexandrii (strain DSM 17067 / NCIMB 14079 / DFL-11) TaxID=244592 RepID=A0A5E8GWQ7_ROSAD|nr:hypothetical protein [Roseibium alexandrii]EEE43407.1 hypothetical protein SADFL11_693 [Roseibium alexandrii DFL-11]